MAHSQADCDITLDKQLELAMCSPQPRLTYLVYDQGCVWQRVAALDVLAEAARRDSTTMAQR